jgi:multidrug transporter EmrE-like cation transporter
VAWVWLAGAILLEVVATLNLKLSEGFTRFWPSVVVVLGYIGSFSLLGATLKRIDVGTVYAIWSGAGTVVVVFVGIMLFGESATGVRLLGIGVITLGVIVLNLSGGGHGGEAPEAGAKLPPEEPKSKPVARPAPVEAVARPVALVPRQRSGRHVAADRVTSVRAVTAPEAGHPLPGRVVSGRPVSSRSTSGHPGGTASVPGRATVAGSAAGHPGSALPAASALRADSISGPAVSAGSASGRPGPAGPAMHPRTAPAVSGSTPTVPRGISLIPGPRRPADGPATADVPSSHRRHELRPAAYPGRDERPG